MRVKRTNAKGQAVVEYIIIIVIVAIAALVVLGAFSDRLRAMIGGVTTNLGGADTGDDGKTSLTKLKEIGGGTDTGN